MQVLVQKMNYSYLKILIDCFFYSRFSSGPVSTQLHPTLQPNSSKPRTSSSLPPPTSPSGIPNRPDAAKSGNVLKPNTRHLHPKPRIPKPHVPHTNHPPEHTPLSSKHFNPQQLHVVHLQHSVLPANAGDFHAAQFRSNNNRNQPYEPQFEPIESCTGSESTRLQLRTKQQQGNNSNNNKFY